MSEIDIFKLLRSPMTRGAKNKTTKSIEEIFEGGEERVYRKREEKRKTIDDVLNEEIGGEKPIAPRAKTYKELHYGELERLPIKKQLKEYQKAYIGMEDYIKGIERDKAKTEERLNDRSLEAHRAKKELLKAKEIIMETIELLPDGHAVLDLDHSLGDLSSIKMEFLKRIRVLTDRIRQTDDYIEKKTKAIIEENRELKIKLQMLETELLKREQEPTSPVHVTEENKPEVKLEIKPEVKPEVKLEAPPAALEPTIFVEEEEEEEEDDGSYILTGPAEMQKYIDELSETQKYVLLIIGKYGVSRNAELKQMIEEINDPLSPFLRAGKQQLKEVGNDVKHLRDIGFLTAEQVKLGSKGIYNYIVYELTKLGKAIYKTITNEKPVVSEASLIKRDHKTYEHGYLIKESIMEFKSMGYTVYHKREDTTVKLENGERKVFDLILEKDGERCYVEVERGTHNDEDFFKAMNKIYQITNQFYFITPNDDVMNNKVRIQFYKWIGEYHEGIKNVEGKFAIHMTTLDFIKQRKKGIWVSQRF